MRDVGGSALDAMFRMPVSFGPAPGPRNVPHDRQRTRYVHRRVVLSVTARSEAAALAALLPANCTLAGEPLITLTVSQLSDLGWLAGRGYNIVSVQIPNVTFAGKERVSGTFVPVVWENRADPIITGREELGMAKIFADICDIREIGGDHRASAAWDGFRFVDLEAGGFVDADAPATAPPPTLLFKYMPRTGQWGTADTSTMTVSGIDPNEPPTTVHRHRTGSGRFRFRHARWEDMPTQYPIVNALADLPLHDFRGATLKETSQGEVDSVGGGNLSGQRMLS